MAVTHTPVNLPNDFSVASMGANNIVIDGRTNSTTAETTLYPCWDPLQNRGSATLSNNNLTYAMSGTWSATKATIPCSDITDGVYWEVKLNTVSGTAGELNPGIMKTEKLITDGTNGEDLFVSNQSGGSQWYNASYAAITGSSVMAAGDVLMFAFKGAKIWLGKNGTWWNSGDPDSDSGEIQSSITGSWSPAICASQDSSFTAHFDSDSFVYPIGATYKTDGFSPITKTVTGFGNYATLNPLAWMAAAPTLSLGNTSLTSSSGGGAVSTISLPATGKWKVEFTLNLDNSSNCGVYSGDLNKAVVWADSIRAYEAQIDNDGSSAQTGLTNISTGAPNIITMLVNMYADTIQYKLNDSNHGSALTLGTPGNSGWSFFCYDAAGANSWTCNFGATGFAYTDADYKALATHNLPTPSYTPSDYFNTVLYNGNGSDGNAITGVGFAADFIWIKDRENGMSHRLYDSIRGVNAALRSDTADPQDQLAGYGQLETTGGAFSGADGFTVGVGTNSDGTQGDGTNKSGEKHVAWCWKAGGAPTATNSGGINPTSGSRMKGGSAITTAYASANIYPVKMTTAAHGGSSIFTYTGTGTNGHTVPHGLDAAPSFVVIKDVTDSNQDAWQIGHVGMTSYDYTLAFNSADAQDNSANWWNDTAPSATLITLGDVARSNDSGETHVCYAFADIEGVQKFGVYAGNSTTSTPKEGPFVYLGFKPNLVIIKSLAAAAGGSGDGGHWHMFDNVRSPGNPSKLELNVNGAGAEGDPGNERIDFTANGFKIRDQYDCNGSGRNYVYAAFGATAFASNNRAK